MSKSTFAERLQRLMTERDISQSDLAREIFGTITETNGYEAARNRQVIGKYLSGATEPRMATKRKLAAALKVPLSILAPESDPTIRPGSGIHIDPVDNQNSRLRLDLVAPKDVVRRVVETLIPYTT